MVSEGGDTTAKLRGRYLRACLWTYYYLPQVALGVARGPGAAALLLAPAVWLPGMGHNEPTRRPTARVPLPLPLPRRAPQDLFVSPARLITRQTGGWYQAPARP